MEQEPLTWDPDDFCATLRDIRGRDAAAAARPYAAAVGRKINFARFHASEHIAVLEKGVPDETALAMTLLLGAKREDGTGPDEATRDAFLEARWRGEAHLTAFIQAIHAVPDSIAQLLYALALLNRDGRQPDPRRLYLKKAKEMLAEDSASYLAIGRLLDSTEFAVLDAAANTIKHHSVIEAPFHISFVDEQQHGLRMARFTRGSQTYEARWARDFLNSTWDSLVPAFIRIMLAIEQDLSLPRDAST